MKEKLIALDLDGTLLNPQGQLTDFTKEVIGQVRQQGHKIIIATGRPFQMAKRFYQELALDTPMISFNGALTHLPNQAWRYEQDIRLDKAYLLDMIKREKELEAVFIAAEYRKKFFITHNHVDDIDPELFGVEAIAPHTRLIADKVTDDPNAILLQTRAKDKYALAEEMQAFYKQELEIGTWGGPLNILECSPKGVTKALALQHLLQVYNRAPQDLIAFGDEHNDVTMFGLAGTSYAMKNASDRLLPYASHQLDFSNAEDGVAKQLQALFL